MAENQALNFPRAPSGEKSKSRIRPEDAARKGGREMIRKSICDLFLSNSCKGRVMSGILRAGPSCCHAYIQMENTRRTFSSIFLNQERLAQPSGSTGLLRDWISSMSRTTSAMTCAP